MNLIKLFRDFHIPMASPGQRHYRQGWVNTPCPFCTGHPGNHLGYCIDSKSEFFGRFVCHRCGGKNTFRTISKLLGIEEEARVWSIIGQYGGATKRTILSTRMVLRPPRNVDLPPRTTRLMEVPGAIRYLKGRKFDPEEIEQVWKVMATGPGAVVKSKDGKQLDFSYRLIIPVYHQDKLVTYQGRDWTGKSSRKYLACLPELESRSIKSLLYGMDLVSTNETVLMEGVTDVWRYGAGAVACFGVKYHQNQVRELLKRFDRIVMAFDPEAVAKIQTWKLMRELKENGVDVIRMKLPKGRDPGDMTREELFKLLK